MEKAYKLIVSLSGTFYLFIYFKYKNIFYGEYINIFTLRGLFYTYYLENTSIIKIIIVVTLDTWVVAMKQC